MLGRGFLVGAGGVEAGKGDSEMPAGRTQNAGMPEMISEMQGDLNR